MGMDELRHAAGHPRSGPPYADRALVSRDLSDRELIGRTIADYQLLEVLGRGGMGTVYLAEGIRRNAGHRVAIKVLSSQFAQHAVVAARFEAEAHTITRIDHPNIIRVYDFGALEDGTLYHVLELAEGQELSKLLEERPAFSAQEAAPFVDQICRGLQAAHDSGVVHRDLKPENIIVLREQPLSLKILDFGIAKLLDPGDWVKLTATGMVLGTPLFIAPEQALGDLPRIGPQTDIYSLGVVLYTMLAGDPPFYDTSPGLLLARHIKDPAPSLLERQPGLSPAVAQVVHRCLEKDPQRRYRSALELCEAYLAALGPEDIGNLNTVCAVDTGRSGPDTICEASAPELDTVVDHVPPADMVTDDVEALPFTGSLPLSGLEPYTPDPLTPLPLVSPDGKRRRRMRNLIALGLAGGAIVLIIVLMAVTAYLAAS
jgi:serine/threonine protein kinase